MKAQQIQTTKDYDKFQVYNYNRGINRLLVRKIIKSISEIGYMEGKPVIVDKSFAIIDGQHRFTACVELGLPIQYVVTAVDPEKAIIELNANQVNWKMQDYVNMYAEQGIKCYQHLLDFEERRKFGINYSATILFTQNSNNDGNNVTKIRKGHRYSINPNSEKIADFILSSGLPYNKTSFFIRAVVRLFKVATPEQLAKVKAGLMGISQQPNTASYMAVFENIVNRKVHAKNHVSFK